MSTMTMNFRKRNRRPASEKFRLSNKIWSQRHLQQAMIMSKLHSQANRITMWWYNLTQIYKLYHLCKACIVICSLFSIPLDFHIPYFREKLLQPQLMITHYFIAVNIFSITEIYYVCTIYYLCKISVKVSFLSLKKEAFCFYLRLSTWDLWNLDM